MQLELDARSTALILIDLQNGIVSLDVKPHSAADVIQRSAELAGRFRAAGGTVVYVRVDLSDLQRLPVDRPNRDPNAPPPPAAASELVPQAGMKPGDLLINKRQWGAFFKTDLEAKLREKNIQTVVIAGIATNMGVESTARASAGLGFATVLVEDAMSTLSAEMHAFAIEKIFPRLGRVRKAAEIELK